MNHSFTDQDLFKLIATGNEAAFTELFRRYDKSIYPFVLKMVKSASLAEAITAAVFIRIWNNRKELVSVAVPADYIFSAASSEVAAQLKISLPIQLNTVSPVATT